MKLFPNIILITIALVMILWGQIFPEASWQKNILFAIATGVIPTVLVELIFNFNDNSKYWKLVLKTHFWYRWKTKLIRFSISYLYRIKIGDKYLLVKGKRIDQIQPPGGVYKRYPESIGIFGKLGVQDDKCIPIDSMSKNDLRVRVPTKNVIKFIKWFYSKKDRETCQWREFCEELLETNILDRDQFKHIQSRFVREVRKDYKFSEYYQCWEILLYEVYELIPTPGQDECLKKLLENPINNEFVIVREDLIESLGYNSFTKNKDFSISEHSKYIL